MHERTAVQFVADGVNGIAPLRVQLYVRTRARDAHDGAARIVGRKVPTLEGSARLLRDGKLNGTALHRDRILRIGYKHTAVQPIVDFIFARGKDGGKLFIRGDLARKSDKVAGTVRKSDKIVTFARRGLRREPIFRGHLVLLPVHGDGVHRSAARQEHGDADGRRKEQGAQPQPRERKPPAPLCLYGRFGAVVLRDGEIQPGKRLAEMFREEEQLVCARADDAALPFGNDVRRRFSGAGNGILPLAPALAQRGEFFAQTRGVENARKSLPGYRCAGKPLQRHVQRRSHFAQQRNVRLGNAAFPLGNRLQMHVQLLRKLRLGIPRRPAQFFQPFPEAVHP